MLSEIHACPDMDLWNQTLQIVCEKFSIDVADLIIKFCLLRLGADHVVETRSDEDGFLYSFNISPHQYLCRLTKEKQLCLCDQKDNIFWVLYRHNTKSKKKDDFNEERKKKPKWSLEPMRLRYDSNPTRAILDKHPLYSKLGVCYVRRYNIKPKRIQVSLLKEWLLVRVS